MGKDDLHLMHSWLTDPGEFFARLFDRWVNISKRKQDLVAAVTFLVPLATAACMTVFILKNAVVITTYRFVPEEWAPAAYFAVCFFVMLGIRGYHHSLLVAKRVRYWKGRFSRFLPPVIPALDHARNNMCMLPALVIFACMALTFTSFTWNVYHYGFYLMFMFWFGLLWSGYLIGHSTRAIPAINSAATVSSPAVATRATTITVNSGDASTSTNHNLNAREPTKKSEVRRVIITTVIVFLLFSLILDSLLPFVIGAERLPLFFKLAYFLMHGN